MIPVSLVELGEEERRLFLEELEEQIQVLEEGFLALEREGASPEGVAACFRAAHTVKGSAGAVGLLDMSRVAHALENVLDRVRAGELKPRPEVVDALFGGLDCLRRLRVQFLEGGEVPEVEAVTETLAAVAAGGGRQEDRAERPAGSPEVPPAVWEAWEEQNRTGTPLAVHVLLAEDGPMPAVRAYQAYLVAQERAAVLGSRPSLDDIEAERVDGQVTLYVAAEGDPEELRAALLAVGDVRGVTVEPLAPPDRPAERPGVQAPPWRAGEGGGQKGPERGSPGGGERTGDASGEGRTVRVDVSILDNLMNLVGELVIDRNRLSQLAAHLSGVAGVEELAADVARVSNHLTRVTGFLQDELLRARMLPIDRLFKKFPRMVRDLARSMGKEIEFTVRGGETELDRALIEVLGDPLIHLLRNAVDHGLETAEERRRAGKDPVGRVSLLAYQRDNTIVVEVADDGRGIDPERMRAAAVARGLLTPEQARELPDREACALIFSPGFSTAAAVSEVSGRGVGMDIVRRNVERVGGRVDLESEAGRGTTFRLVLPLTLATIRALLVRAGEGVFALPLASVAETIRLARQDIRHLKGQKVITVRDQVIPLRWLSDCLGLPREEAGASGRFYSVLVHGGGRLVGLVVDALLGEQEIVIKNLGRFIGGVEGLAGATILGDGSLALILDARGLLSGWRERPGAGQSLALAAAR